MKTHLAAAALALAIGAQAQAATYAIDPTHTFVTYEIGHFGTSTNRGRFDKKEGTVQFDRAAKTGKVEISFDLSCGEHRRRGAEQAPAERGLLRHRQVSGGQVRRRQVRLQRRQGRRGRGHADAARQDACR